MGMPVDEAMVRRHYQSFPGQQQQAEYCWQAELKQRH